MSSIERRGRRSVTLALFVAALLAGCKAKESAQDPEAAGSASAAAAPSGPCGDYLAKVCEAAGKESATCQATEVASKVMSPKACEVAVKEIAYSRERISAQRGKCDELVKKLCAAVGPETETCKMVTSQTQQFPPERCEAMLGQVGEIVADLKKREEMNKPLSSELMATIAAGDAPSFGPENAKVTIVEFSDFQCPYCSRAAEVASKIKQKYGDKVRFVFRQYPLPFHPNARGAAEAALAAHAQGKFWEFHDHLFEHQSELDRAALEKHAQETGLNVASFKQALDEKKYAEAVDKDMKLGEKVVVQGTPTMFLNGKRVSDPTNFDMVQTMIDEALKS